MDSGTIVAAALDSSQLEQSINKLVATVASKTKEMADNFTSEVGRMEKAIKNLGNIKIDSGGTADGGSSRRAKLFSQEGEVIQRNNQIAKEYNTTLDQQAAAIRKASQVSVRTGDAGSIRNADTLQTMNIQLDLLRERLREARQQYSSFVALASHATTTGDKGLYQFATEGVHKYGDEVRSLIPQIRGVQNAIQQMGDVIAPQGHTIQNYVNSLQKTNPELALLNEQFKKGQSELQNQSTSYSNATQSAHQYTEEIRKQAQAIRESQQWKEKGYATVNGVTLYNLEKDTTPLKSRIALEEQLLQLHKSEQSSMLQQAAEEEKVAQATRLTGEELKKIYQNQKAVNEEINKRANGVRNGGTTPFQSYDSLRQSIAAVLGIQEQQVKMADAEKDSYNKLASTLKQLKQAYDTLGKSDRNSDQGKTLVASMHEVERAMQRIKAQAARPVSLESIIGINGKGGLSEKTLDDIAYKMQRLSSLRSGLNVETQQTEIRTVNAEYDRLKKKMDEVMQKNQSMIASNNALGRSWNYMKNRLAFYVTVGASTQFIKNLIEVRSQYEMNERALGILINSAERGTQIFNELSQMALVSPYTLIELSAAAKQLTAYDIAARDVVDTTRRLADMASAVGVPIERLTYALGQIKAYGYLNSRDARMFANAGIPLVKQLSDYYTELEGKMVSTADVYDRMKKKAIDYNSVMSVITKMTDEGGKFFDFQAKMADTLKVRLANLTLAWNNMLNDMGKETQGVLTWSIGALRNLFLQWKNLYGALNEVAFVFGVAKALQFLGVCAHAAGVGFGSLNKYMTLNSLLGTKLATTVRTLGNAFMSLVHSPLAWFTMAALLVTEIGDAFINADRATKEFNKSLRDGAKTTYEDLKKFAEQYKNVRDSLYKTEKEVVNMNVTKFTPTGNIQTTIPFKTNKDISVAQDIDDNEAKKVWEAMREQIELSSHASDEYISKLLSIENVSERLRQGFQILDDIQTVSAALKEIGEDGIKVTQSWAAWWNAWQGADGLIGNVKDLQKEIQRLQDTGQDTNDKFTKVIDKDYATALERFRKDLKVTTDSVIDFINLNGWSGDAGKIDEVFKQVTDRLATQGNLDPQTAFTLQREAEIARAKAAKEALEIRIADEKNALATASDEISKQQIQKNLETLEQQKRDFDKFNGENRAYWNDFTKYIKERHISELTAAYNSMTDHGKKAMDFQSEEWQKRVHDWANRYEKSHNLATDSVFNRLRNWINDANTWSVFIKMTISTEDGKSVYKQLEEYDKVADDAWKTMQRLDKRIDQLRKKGAKEVEGAETGAIDLSRVSQDDRELTEALKERTQAQKDYNDAVEKGGESKKENSAASKAQKQAESELAKALKDELKLIETVRSSYKDLTKDGASHAGAVEKSVSGYEKSVANINKVLEKYGVKLDLTKFAGIANPHELQEMFKQQLNALAGKAKPTEIQALEVELQKVNLDVEKYDLTKITKGLNNELDKLKDEYELALDLDANPELGDVFADMMGLDKEQLAELPRDFEGVMNKLQGIIDDKLGNGVFNLRENLNKASFENWLSSQGTDLDNERAKILNSYVDYANKVRQDETKKQIDEWNKLLEKYAEYEYKRKMIAEEAARELEIARKKGAGQDIIDAIEKKRSERVAQTYFDEFQQSPMWITATGNLADMTDDALRTLAADIERFKNSAKGLSAKNIKEINKALTNISKEQKKNNPFKSLAISAMNAKERMATFDEEIKNTEKELNDLYNKQDQSNLSETGSKISELVEKLKNLKEAQKKAGEIDATEVVAGINSMIQVASQAVSMFTEMANALSGDKWNEGIEVLNDVMSTIDKAGQGAAIGAQVGGGWGAIIGGVAGGIMGAITAFADNGNKKIDAKLKESEVAVKRLEAAYVDLQNAMDKAYGTGIVGSKRLLASMKELELAELERQLALEQSRSSKDRDEGTIADLQKQIKELRYEIEDTITEISNELLGGEAGSFAENLVSSMIDAFKNGEDYMKVFEDKFDEMVDNMIMKSITSKVVAQYIDKIWDDMDARIKVRSTIQADELARVTKRRQELESMDIYAYGEEKGIGKYGIDTIDDTRRALEEMYNKELAAVKEAENAAQKAYDAASTMDDSDISTLIAELAEIKPELGEKLREILGEYYKFGETSNKELSALQQGISGITETTAGALEAYMNGVSQQVYYQSDLLTQIRDAVVEFNMDVQVASMSQILLQLRSSYEMQTAIHSVLEGWSSPNGMSVRVEMV